MTDFPGRIGRTYRDSQPWWPPAAAAPARAPHVVFIVLDDVGFSDLGCYGSEIRTPHMDALATGGLRYNNFHVTAMCSPTRACLLTGRNAHAVGVGAIAEWSNGFPGYQGCISKSAATVAEMLATSAYGTYAIGKWHLSNLADYTAAGPHENWPLGRGFSRWYGFLGGYVDHWNPDLHEDNHVVRTPEKVDYHLSEDLVDRAIGNVRDHVSSANGRPLFLYLAFGAAHWPHHVPQAYIERYAGEYDVGWDVVRERRLAKQKALGIVPADTVLAPRNAGVDPWDALGADQKRVSARLQETYAAFMEHTDAQIGRFVDYLRAIGELDNTLIVLLSDNGASGEGGPTGAVNIRKHMLTEAETTEYALGRIDSIGGEHSFPHYPFGWAQVSNTPLKWYKKNTHGGGIRAPLIVHWPDRIRTGGQIRSQYHHVIDVVPTVLTAAGTRAPESYRGVPQMPLHGIDMAYTFDDAAAPTRRPSQYFEIVGDRAIWADGWKAVTRHVKGEDFDLDRWELYDTTHDFSETRDLAAEQPQRVADLVALWWTEAERFGVFPLDDRETQRAFAWFADNTPDRYEYLPGMARADRLMIPAITDRAFRIGAELEGAACSGVILAIGNRFGGLILYAQDGRATLRYVYTEDTAFEVSVPLGTGMQTVTVDFERTAKQQGRYTISRDGQEPASTPVLKTWTTYGITAGLTCGYLNTPFDLDLRDAHDFRGHLRRVVVELLGPSADHGDGFRAILQEE